MILLIWFGMCAAVLAATGVYSVIAEAMAAREREIAIKNALGAQRSRLVRDMISSTLALVLIGELLGACIVCALGRLGSGLLYGISERDPLVLASVSAFLFLVSLWSALWPAWSATGGELRASLRAN